MLAESERLRRRHSAAGIIEVERADMLDQPLLRRRRVAGSVRLLVILERANGLAAGLIALAQAIGTQLVDREIAIVSHIRGRGVAGILGREPGELIGLNLARQRQAVVA